MLSPCLNRNLNLLDIAKILVADDEIDLEMLIKQKFRKQIRENKYDFIFALNGIQALEKLQENPDIAIVISDINMPGMDGLSLLAQLRKKTHSLKRSWFLPMTISIMSVRQ